MTGMTSHLFVDTDAREVCLRLNLLGPLLAFPIHPHLEGRLQRGSRLTVLR